MKSKLKKNLAQELIKKWLAKGMTEAQILRALDHFDGSVVYTNDEEVYNSGETTNGDKYNDSETEE